MLLTVILHPTPKASSKTKNRLTERGPHWTIVQDGSYDNKPAFLCRSIRDSYYKWFFKDEVEVEYV